MQYNKHNTRAFAAGQMDGFKWYRNSLGDHQFHYSCISLTMPVFRAIVSYMSNDIRRKDAVYKNTQP